jgi:hypothetical protein
MTATLLLDHQIRTMDVQAVAVLMVAVLPAEEAEEEAEDNPTNTYLELN